MYALRWKAAWACSKYSGQTPKRKILTFWASFASSESAPSKLEFSLHSPDGMSDKFWGEAHWYARKGDFVDFWPFRKRKERNGVADL